ncbi:hypothetical protein RCZ02_16410 [Capnocytophaga felis]|uniref:hypothetical protein n=1 Tax=Capnocytophaga felis TaxID=2267611 RepID=UPI0012C75734|nr:hypothetical protein [Capnocytophaga felis]GET48810.1 hypothetical protein RCZ02_16410 [Capnocytophaga felis]
MTKVIGKYNIDDVVQYLYDTWITDEIRSKIKEALETQVSLSGPSQERGKEGEDYILKTLNNKQIDKGWTFKTTPQSRTCADIVGIRENTETVYFLLIQVKTGNPNYLSSKFDEVKTFPILKDILVKYLKHKKEKRKVLICTCFVLIETEDTEINSKTKIDTSGINFYHLKNADTIGRKALMKRTIKSCEQK